MIINPNKYIKTIEHSPCPTAFINSAIDGIKTLGYSGESLIKSKNLSFVLAQKASDAFPELKGITPRGWPRNMTWDQAGAISANGVIGCFSEPDAYEISSTIRHEVGHEVDKSFSKSIGKRITDCDSYSEAYLKDLKNLSENLKSQKYIKEKDIYYLLQNSTSKKATDGGKRETFAEIYALLHGGGNGPQVIKGFNKMMSVIFPNTINYVKKLISFLGDK